jgi:2-polyprenyl-3-methyl-5-hydroxy-6-metoxy-1,4-benzoquinol methylase
MENGTRKNSLAWEKVYKTTNFGNRYPTDGLVSLYHHFVKDKMEALERPAKILDFGCSHGANAKFFASQGFDVYGIDISEDAIVHCVQEVGFDSRKFRACDVLGEGVSIEDIFGVEFDLVIASECLYYFSQRDFERILERLYNCMREGAVFYGNMHTWNHHLYRKYRHLGVNREGLAEIPMSGTADLPLSVRIVEGKEEMREIFQIFEEIVTVRSVLELESENETLHFIGKKVEKKQTSI